MINILVGLLTNSGVPLLPGFSYTKTITIDNTGNPIALTNHQIQIDLTSSNFNFLLAKTNGEDIRFTKPGDFTLLNYWIKSYNSGSSLGTILVKITHIPAFSVGTIYIHFGNSGATSLSNWGNTIQRTELSLSGGNTQYLLKCDEGTGATLTNFGSAGGALSVAGTTPIWQSTNTYNQTGTCPRLNGTNNAILIPTLLDTWPIKGEISLTFRPRALPTGGGQVALIEKFNAIGTANPDLGAKFGIYLFEASGSVYVRIDTFTSATSSPINFNNYTRFVTNDRYLRNITLGSTHNLTVVWNEGSIAFYLDAKLCQRHNFYPSNGHGSDFTIGAVRVQTTGAIGSYTNVEINDFRYTDYTGAQEPRLPQIEAEHTQTRFLQSNVRNKFAVNRYLTASNIRGREAGHIDGRLLNAATGIDPAYYVPLLEPHILYDFDDSKFKLWYNDLLFTPIKLFYKEATTLAGLASASPILCVKSGSIEPQRPVIYKENGTYHLYYNNRYSAGGSALLPVYHQTSTDGINYTTETIALAVPSSGFGSYRGWENVSISKIGSTYYMLVEGLYSDGVGGFTNQTGYATANNVAGPYTIISTVPISAFGGPLTSPGGPAILKSGGNDYVFYHKATTTDLTYSATGEMALISTPDYNTFTPYSGTPGSIIGRIPDEIYATDQFADVCPTTNNIKTQLAYSANYNGPARNFFGSVFVAEFDGTPAQLLKDLTIIIS